MLDVMRLSCVTNSTETYSWIDSLFSSKVIGAAFQGIMERLSLIYDHRSLSTKTACTGLLVVCGLVSYQATFFKTRAPA